MDSPGAWEALGEHQDPARFGEPDNTLRIQFVRKRESDEGIVQPAAKAVDVLSPRLHQLPAPASGRRGSFVCERRRPEQLEERRRFER
ncbi:MAG: hypothetical protein ACT4O5_07350 [Gammaproteobacteria bacterium]